MSDAIVQQEARPLTAAEVKAQVQLVQQVMSAVMIKDKHYGTVPGCGDKPTLLKPGAEKLMMTFRLAADPQVQEIPTDDGITFRVICRITNQATGLYLGSGIGECSSKEEKYNWRKAVCEGEFNDTSEDRRRKKWGKGYSGKPDYQTPQIRTNPADVANTVLKMAKKRALVDAILTVTAASDIFDQDLEEMPEELRQNGEPQSKKTETVKPAGNKSPESSAEGKKDVRQALKEELAAYCGGDVAKMKEVLKEISCFIGNDKKEVFINGIAAIDKAKDSWVGSSLGKLRDLVKKVNNASPAATGEPTNCTHDAISCEVVMWDVDGKPLCNGKPCPYYKEPESF